VRTRQAGPDSTARAHLPERCGLFPATRVSALRYGARCFAHRRAGLAPAPRAATTGPAFASWPRRGTGNRCAGCKRRRLAIRVLSFITSWFRCVFSSDGALLLPPPILPNDARRTLGSASTSGLRGDTATQRYYYRISLCLPSFRRAGVPSCLLLLRRVGTSVAGGVPDMRLRRNRLALQHHATIPYQHGAFLFGS